VEVFVACPGLSVWGKLAGDSLGGLVEFRDPVAITKEFPAGVRDLRDGGTWDNLSGQPTDDSEMALMLARTLVHQGKFDRGAVLNAYLHWWPRAWDRGSTPQPGFVRGSPVGDDRREAGISRFACEQIEPIERVPDADQPPGDLRGKTTRRSGCLGPGGLPFDPPTTGVSRGLRRLCCRHRHGPWAMAVLRKFVTKLPLPKPDGKTRTGCAGNPENARTSFPVDYCSQNGLVLIGLQNAFYQLLHAPSFEDGVVDTVMRGGDTDTNGAIAGALLGAVHGRAKVPPPPLGGCKPVVVQAHGGDANPTSPAHGILAGRCS